MESEDLDLQSADAWPSSTFLDYIYHGALAVAIARIHYTYLNKLRKDVQILICT